uniref:Uncharacterized protein n=1 Tax=Nothoprocta perdicaria TaxID=30464 RepID=A0A8C6ZKG0_NOTPE
MSPLEQMQRTSQSPHSSNPAAPNAELHVCDCIGSLPCIYIHLKTSSMCSLFCFLLLWKQYILSLLLPCYECYQL